MMQNSSIRSRSVLKAVMPLTRKGAFLSFGVAVLIMVSIVLMLVEIIVSQPLKCSVDGSMFLAIGRMLIDGKIPYVDFFELNPPLVLYAHAVPAYIVGLLPLPLLQSFNLVVLALFVVSLGVSTTILWRNREHPEATLFPALLVSFALVTFFYDTCVSDFGQREHLFILSYFPFFLIRWLRSTGHPASKPAGILCAIPVAVIACFKPQFLLVVIVTELALYIQNPRAKEQFKTLEVMVLPAMLVLYGIFLLIIPANMREGYFGFILPTYKLGYDAYASSTTSLLAGTMYEFRFAIALSLSAIAGALIFATRSTLLAPLVAFTFAGLAIYLMQGNVWINRAMPFLAGGFMLFGIEIGIIFSMVSSAATKHRSILKFSFATSIVILLFAFIIDQRSRQCTMASDPQPFDLSRIGYAGHCPRYLLWPGTEIILNETKENDPILFMSTLIAPAYPTLVHLKRQAASRYLHGMPMTALWYARENSLNISDRETAKRLLTRVLQDYSIDIQRNKPRLIFVKSKIIAPLIQEDDSLTKAFLAYDKIAEIDGHDVYRLRRSAP